MVLYPLRLGLVRSLMGFESPETPWAHDDEGERGTSAPSCSSRLLGKGA